MSKNKYSAFSTVLGIITSGRWSLLLKPHLIFLDVDRRVVIAKEKKEYVVLFDDISIIEIIYHKHCADIDIETSKERFIIKCLDSDDALEIRDYINIYLWEKNQPNL
ncbi:MAG: hypothetical protein LBD45_07510 [Bacteroidales bacterium]|jgi:hypothetical protein|nr:hypothetical protein [Bacteroidales bacterium]